MARAGAAAKAKHSQAVHRTTVTAVRIRCIELFVGRVPGCLEGTIPLCRAERRSRRTSDQLVTKSSAVHQETIIDPQRTLMQKAGTSVTVVPRTDFGLPTEGYRQWALTMFYSPSSSAASCLRAPIFVPSTRCSAVAEQRRGFTSAWPAAPFSAKPRRSH